MTEYAIRYGDELVRDGSWRCVADVVATYHGGFADTHGHVTGVLLSRESCDDEWEEVLFADERDAALIIAREATDSGTRTDLDDVITAFGFDRTELEAELSDERADVLARFAAELAKATGDGSRKRQAGTKPPWYEDDSHAAAMYRHLERWEAGERHDPDHEAHPLVAAAWRCLAIACKESGNVPNG